LARLRDLHRVLTKVSQPGGLDATLQAVADAVVEGLGFQVAAVNALRADGAFVVRAVAGSAQARRALLGSVTLAEHFEQEFQLADGGEGWGNLRFVPRERLSGPGRGWVPPTSGSAAPGGWHPEDALFAPLHGSSGDLVGVLSVDLPRDGRRPGPLERELLETFAAQAGIAIDNARLAEQLRQDHERLRVSEQSLRLAFDGSDVGMAMVDLGPDDPGRFLRVNPALARLLGHRAEQLTQMRVADVAHPQDLQAHPDGLSDALPKALAEGSDSYRIEHRYLRADGEVLWLEVTNSILRDDRGEVVYGFVQVHDITARRATEQQLVEAATRDPLTGVANRAALRTHLASTVAGCRRAGCTGAVVYVDLDGFKQVNDSLGHHAGDAMLCAVATRLQGALRDGDMVARVGGDEFVLVVQGIQGQDLQALLSRLLGELAEPIWYRGSRARVTASLGVAVLDESADPDTLLQQADTAMYQAKQARRNQHCSRAP
jgi:diguanylate cyclase (GGDEF)-like protein/PAS domain S-box-containing protein